MLTSYQGDQKPEHAIRNVSGFQRWKIKTNSALYKSFKVNIDDNFYFLTFKMIFWVLASKVACLKFWLATYIANQNFKQVMFILYPKCSVVRFQEAYNLLLGSMACISFTEPIKNKVLFLWDSMSLAFSEALYSLNLNDCWL